jgi:cytochrome c553
MKKPLIVLTAVFFVLAGLVFSSLSAQAGNRYQDGTLEQGRYMATISGCTACHTPPKAEYQNPQLLPYLTYLPYNYCIGL